MNKNRFEDIMSAITFAEAGEQEKAREMLMSGKTVLLAVSDRIFDKNVFTYALNICKRVGADMTVLHLKRSGKKNIALLRCVKEIEQAGIRCMIVRRDGCMKKAILDYTEKRREVLFVIVGSTPELEIECKTGEKILTEAWKKLKCPLVVVSKGEMPSIA